MLQNKNNLSLDMCIFAHGLLFAFFHASVRRAMSRENGRKIVFTSGYIYQRKSKRNERKQRKCFDSFFFFRYLLINLINVAVV